MIPFEPEESLWVPFAFQCEFQLHNELLESAERDSAEMMRAAGKNFRLIWRIRLVETIRKLFAGPKEFSPGDELSVRANGEALRKHGASST